MVFVRSRRESVRGKHVGRELGKTVQQQGRSGAPLPGLLAGLEDFKPSTCPRVARSPAADGFGHR